MGSRSCSCSRSFSKSCRLSRLLSISQSSKELVDHAVVVVVDVVDAVLNVKNEPKDWLLPRFLDGLTNKGVERDGDDDVGWGVSFSSSIEIIIGEVMVMLSSLVFGWKRLSCFFVLES